MSLADAVAEQALTDGLAALGLSLSQGQREQLERYLSEIDLWNPRLKLVAATGSELVVKHVLDSLAPHGVLTSLLVETADADIADLGAGAGLPGIPLAIALPHFRFTLVERSGRRAGFLRNGLAVLKLQNAAICEDDVFNVAARQPNRWSAVIMRAFLPLDSRLLEAIASLLDSGGSALLYKGRAAAAEKEVALAAAHPAFSGADLMPVKVPFLSEERHLIVLRRA